MKNFLIPIVFILVIIISCKKEKKSDELDTSKPLNFISLVASDSTILVNSTTKITATATGDELIYIWSCEWGTFIGSGSVVDWTVCHADTFNVKCEVKDKYNNSESKYAKIITE